MNIFSFEPPKNGCTVCLKVINIATTFYFWFKL